MSCTKNPKLRALLDFIEPKLSVKAKGGLFYKLFGFLVILCSISNAETVSESEAREAVRTALALQVDDLAYIQVSPEQHDDITSLVDDYVAINTPAISQHVDAFVESQRAMLVASSDPDQFSTACEQYTASAAVIAQSSLVLLTEIRDKLTPLQQGRQQLLQTHILFDPAIALIPDLTSGQLDQIEAAHYARDRVLLNVRNWHRHSVRLNASKVFDLSISEILTGSQLETAEQYRNIFSATFLDMLEHEFELMQVQGGQSKVPAGEESSLKKYAVPILKWLQFRAKVLTFINNNIMKIKGESAIGNSDEDKPSHKVMAPDQVSDETTSSGHQTEAIRG